MFAFGEHVAGFVDSDGAGFCAFAGGDPLDPVSAGARGDVGPCFAGRGWGRGEGLFEVGGDGGLGFLIRSERGDVECDGVADLDVGGVAERAVDFEPVATLAVGLEGGLEGGVVEGAGDGDLAARGEFCAGDFWKR